MAKVEFKPNTAGFVELRNSGAVQAHLLDRANSVQAAAQSGGRFANRQYTCDVQAGKSRAHARVSTASRGAYWDAMRNKTLALALDSARG